MNIIAIISRDLEKGSTKYRLVQYLDFLSKKGINIEFINRHMYRQRSTDVLTAIGVLAVLVVRT